MRLSELLTADRIVVDGNGEAVPDKTTALRLLAGLLAPAVGATNGEVERLFLERERLQSTGIGDGVAIPHTSIDTAAGQAAALLLCPRCVDFEAIDGLGVSIIFGVVGPKRSTSEHLKVLARISRLLRDAHTRVRLIEAPTPNAALELVESHESGMR